MVGSPICACQLAIRHSDPSSPFPYRERDAIFASEAPSVRLAGTVVVPQGAGSFPGVIPISGSGANDRDCTAFGHKPFPAREHFPVVASFAMKRVCCAAQ
jgi:hypothetical protein